MMEGMSSVMGSDLLGLVGGFGIDGAGLLIVFFVFARCRELILIAEPFQWIRLKPSLFPVIEGLHVSIFQGNES
jgi:hypothetical protein